MDKRLLAILCFTATVLLGCIVGFLCYSQQNVALRTEPSETAPVIHTFSLDDYREEIEEFPSDQIVAEVHDRDSAIARAKELWYEKYTMSANRGKAPDLYPEPPDLPGLRLQPRNRPVVECLAVVIPIYSGEEADITDGALYFHNFSDPSDWPYHDDYTQVYIDGTEGFWFYK